MYIRIDVPAGSCERLKYCCVKYKMIHMTDVLDLVKSVLDDVLERLTKPRDVICGFKGDISSVGGRITNKSTPIHRKVTVFVRSLGTGTYIAFGNEDEQPVRLLNVGANLDIDWIDDLSKVNVSTDAGNTGAIEWIGG